MTPNPQQHPADWRRLGAGVYSDDEGTMHLDTAEVLAASGYDPTPENVGIIERLAADTFAKLGIEVEVVE